MSFFSNKILRFFFLPSPNHSRKSSNIFDQARKSVASGRDSGLTVLLNPDVKDYYASTFSGYGFEVMIHESYDYPDWNSEIKYIPTDSEAFISVIPETTYSEVEVEESDISSRLCYGIDEVKLYVLRKYSDNNCMAECRRMIAVQRCNCVPFNYARNGTFQVCNLIQMECIFNISREFKNSFGENVGKIN